MAPVRTIFHVTINVTSASAGLTSTGHSSANIDSAGSVNQSTSVSPTGIAVGGTTYLSGLDFSCLNVGTLLSGGGSYHLQPAALNAAMICTSAPSILSAVTAVTNEPSVSAEGYRGVTGTLEELSTTHDDEWRIDGDVYATSMQVAAALCEKNIPSPHVFSHGARSVVFNWGDSDHELYLTVGKRRIWAAVSSPSEIKTSIELTGPSNNVTDEFLQALQQRFSHKPMLGYASESEAG